MPSRFATFLAMILTFALSSACQRTDIAEEETASAPSDTSAAPSPLIVDVVAVDYAFQAPAEVPAGWTSFRLENQGQEPHFFILWKLPEGKTLEDYAAAVGPAFGEAYGALKAGTADKAEAGLILAKLLPEWYGAVQAMGGVGLLTPGQAARATVKLDPGTYVMECYVKTPEGKFHIELGMAQVLTVTADSTSARPPDADAEITLSNEGIAGPTRMAPGEHTVAVRFEEHPDVGLGNDVHVARLGEGTERDAVVQWMDWMNVEGLRAPAPTEFLGGAEEMPVGHTAYFMIDLAPGRYAWIGEASSESPKVEEFTVE